MRGTGSGRTRAVISPARKFWRETIYDYICDAMTIFPTQYSTLSSAALKDHLEKQYGFQNMACRLLIRNVSDTYILEGAGVKYIFKIYRDNYRKLDEIAAEVELLNILKAGEARVAYPIADLQDKFIQQFQAAESIRNGVLFCFATGLLMSYAKGLTSCRKNMLICGKQPGK
jgi:Ser/Thr protein kinase RdoA (MazF antagonist)